MKNTLFKRNRVLLTIGIAILILTPISLRANVFATEVPETEYFPKFYFEDDQGVAYEYSILKKAEGNIKDSVIGVELSQIQKNSQTLAIGKVVNEYFSSSSEINYQNYIELAGIINKNYIATEKELEKYDLFKDNIIDVRDIVTLQNHFYSTPTNFLINSVGEKMPISVFFELIKEHRNNGETDFVIFSNDSIEQTQNKEETTSITTELTTETNINSETTIQVFTTIELETETESEITTNKVTTTFSGMTEPEVTTVLETTVTTIQETTVTTIPETTIYTTTLGTTVSTIIITTEPTTTTEETTTSEPTELPKDPDGWEIDQIIYDSLVYSAQLFGIKNYKIVWTENEIVNSIIYADARFCDTYCLQQNIPIQLCTLSDIRENHKEFVEELGLNIDTYDFEYFVWRPIVEGNWQDEKFDFNSYRCELIYLDQYGWKYNNWCLIPLDENEQEDLRILTDAKEKSFINNIQLNSEGETIPPGIDSIISQQGEKPGEVEYYSLIQGAKDFGLKKYKFVWADSPIHGAVISTKNNLGWYYRYSFFYYVDEVRFVDRDFFVNKVLDMSLIDENDYYNDDILYVLNSKEYDDFIYIEIEENYDITEQPLLNVNRGLDGKLYCWSIATPETGFVFPKLCIVPYE